jgi:hypothetical protein
VIGRRAMGAENRVVTAHRETSLPSFLAKI